MNAIASAFAMRTSPVGPGGNRYAGSTPARIHFRTNLSLTVRYAANSGTVRYSSEVVEVGDAWHRGALSGGFLEQIRRKPQQDFARTWSQA